MHKRKEALVPMTNRAMSVLCVIIAALLPGAVRAAEGPRDRTLIDAGWRFHRGDFAAAAPKGTPVTQWRWKPALAGGEDLAAVTI